MKEVVTDTREIKQLLKIIVKKKIFKGAEIPEPSNRFFPRTSTYATILHKLNGNFVTLRLNRIVCRRKSTIEVVR